MIDSGFSNTLEKDLSIITEYLKSVGCTEIYLFGSVAEGRASESSDLDIAARGIPQGEFFTVYGEVLTRSSRPVDLVNLDMQKRFGRRILANPNVRQIV